MEDFSIELMEEIEVSLLAGMIQREEVLNLCLNEVKQEYFSNHGYGGLFKAIRDTSLAGELVAVSTLARKDPNNARAIQAIGQSLCTNSLDDIEELYIKPLVEHYERRKLIKAFTFALEDLRANKPVEKIRGKIDAALNETEGTQNKTGPRNDCTQRALQEIETAIKNEGVVGVGTGFPSLDAILGGYANSDLIIIAARPGMGKTALAVNAANTLSKDKKVLFCSIEMKDTQIEMRRLSSLSGISTSDMRAGRVTPEQFKQLTAIKLSNNLWIDDTPGQTAQMILQRARRMKKEHGLDLIIVDYLQFMEAEDMNKSSGRYALVTEISNRLKALAKELDVPVVVLAQLSRAVENRDNKRPQLSDLKESGSIEQDADVVMFIYRHEYYLERNVPIRKGRETEEEFQRTMLSYYKELEQWKGKAEIIVAKQRAGAIGTAVLGWKGETTTFYERTDNE